VDYKHFCLKKMREKDQKLVFLTVVLLAQLKKGVV